MSENNTEGTLKKLPWPKTGDILFQSGEDWWNNACLNYGNDAWELYAIGYKDAADCLADRVAETRSNADSFVYPVAFLYRHYLELRLKDLIVIGHELTDRMPDLKYIHRLDVLWKICRPILEEVWPNSEIDALNAVEECIVQFAHIDPQSMSFRYPADKEGQPTLPNIKHINLRNLKDVMARTATFLECASMGISEYLSHKRSMESYYY